MNSLALAEPPASSLAAIERAPELLILDDDAAVAATLSAMLDIERLKIHRAATCAEALVILRQHPQINVVVVDVCLQGEDGMAFAGDLHRQLGGRAWLQLIVITGQARLDVAISAVRAGVSDFLLKPIRRRDLNEAVQLAVGRSIQKRRQTTVHEGVRQSLERLRQEFEVANSDYQASVERWALDTRPDLHQGETTRVWAVPGGVGALLDWMDLRDQYFGDLFCDPAWNIMLELYQAEIEGSPVSIKRACIAAKVPATTALRRLAELEAAGMVEKQPDRSDKRRLLVALKPTAFDRMTECLKSLFDSN